MPSKYHREPTASHSEQSSRVDLLRQLLELDGDALEKTLLYQLNSELRWPESHGFDMARQILSLHSEKSEEISLDHRPLLEGIV